MTTDRSVLIIGGGPAGLMAAETALSMGCRVTLAEAKPSVGRKFLMAGKSGLNLSRDEPIDRFLSHYGEAAPWLASALHEFGPAEVMAWARDLGQEVFIGSTGRIFPVAMKASPLLRAWINRLGEMGLDLRTRWRWTGFSGGSACFETPQGPASVTPSAVILALGGASWRRLGSDGAWAPTLAEKGVPVTPFQPANVGISVSWSHHMTPVLGQPLKAVALRAGNLESRGETVITARGLEGGGLYPLGPALRKKQTLQIDLFPNLPAELLATTLAAQSSRDSTPNRLRKLGLNGARVALVLELARPFPAAPIEAAHGLKALNVPYTGTRPIDEAISTAGGIAQSALTPDFMIHALPGVFAAGEMLDWEAPTGGYLLTACLATGRRAGQAAARWSAANTRKDQSSP